MNPHQRFDPKRSAVNNSWNTNENQHKHADILLNEAMIPVKSIKYKVF